MWQDVKFAFRSWRQRPALTAALIGMLALGIGATTGVFAVAYAELWRPSPLPHSERLVSLIAYTGKVRTLMTAPQYLLARQAPVFDQVGAIAYGQRLWQDSENAKITEVGRASANMLSLIGMSPEIGRFFSRDEMQAGHDAVAMVSDALWRTNYAAGPSALGKTLRLDDRAYTVIGVLPRHLADTDFGKTPIWIPAVFSAAELADTGRGGAVQVYGRLRPGLTWASAKPQLEAYSAGLHLEIRHQAIHFSGINLAQMQGRSVGRGLLLVLLSAVAMLLLIACANVAGLLLARSVGRQREMALRQALGATRARIFRQLLTEGVLLAVAAGGAGLWLASGIVAWLRASALDRTIFHLDTARLDPAVLGAAVAACMVCAILFSLAPALRSARPHRSALAGMAAAGGSGQRALLVALEIALCLPLLVGAGLTGESLVRLSHVSTGLEMAHLAEVEIQFMPQQMQHPETIAALAPRLLAVARDGGKGRAALVGEPPMDRDEVRTYTLAPSTTLLNDMQAAVGPDYFATMGHRVVLGRAFDEHDTATSPGVVIVNQAWARQYSPHRMPLGLELRWGKDGAESHRVVGVVADVRDIAPDFPPAPELYLDYVQSRPRELGLVVRTPSPQATAVWLRQRIAQAMPGVGIGSAEPVSALMSDDIALPRMQSWMVIVFAAVAGLFALAGIWAMVAFAVQQRQREFGIRIALGAGSGDILRQAMRQIAIWSAGGIAAGLFAAWAASRLIASMLFEVPATDPAVYALVAIGFALAALAAAYAPARRALDADPLATLRCE